jgi:hypothetical protein
MPTRRDERGPSRRRVVYFLMGYRLMRVSASGGAAQRLGLSPYYGGPFSIGPAQ